MHGAISIKLRGKLDPADKLDAGGLRQVDGLVEAGEGVVVGYPQNAESGAPSLLEQFACRAGAVRFVGSLPLN